MSLTILFIVFGLILLFFGAEWLVRGSADLALRLGVSSLVVGLTIVSFGTSAPELVVSVKSALAGHGGIAVGNVIGSNIFNIAAILGLSALIRPLKVRSRLVRLDMPIMIFASFLLAALLYDLRLVRWEGLLLSAGIVAYTFYTVFSSIRSGKVETAEAEQEMETRGRGGVFLDIVLICGGLVALVFGSRFLVDGAVDLARIIGIGEGVVGLTIVAAGTSLPELATSVMAAAKKEEDIAIGNIVGSNIFNILCIMGVSGSIMPLEASGIGPVDMGFMVGTAVLLLPFMWSGFVLSRWEGGLLLCAYVGYILRLWLG